MVTTRVGVQGLGWPLPVPSGLGLWAMAAGWPWTAARPTADLQGRVLPAGHLAGAEGHGRIKLGLEQLELLHRLQGLWGDLGRTPQEVVVLTGVLRQVKEQWGLVGSQGAGSVAGRVCCGVAVGRAWGGGTPVLRTPGSEGTRPWGRRAQQGWGQLPWVKKWALYFPLRTAKTPRISSG